jgi:hypothetical protein
MKRRTPADRTRITALNFVDIENVFSKVKISNFLGEVSSLYLV